jgi:hypothetical protein
VLLKNVAQRRAAWGDWVASKRAKLAAISGSKIAMPMQPLLSMPAGAGATASNKTRSGTNLAGACTGMLLKVLYFEIRDLGPRLLGPGAQCSVEMLRAA